MNYRMKYHSPIGEWLVVSDGEAIIWLGMEGQAHYPTTIVEQTQTNPTLAIFKQATEWLDCYFAGRTPTFTPALSTRGTPFAEEVWEILRKIPYGRVITYRDIAREIATRRGISRFSAQAVGGAVGRNPISLITPCHRVIGSDGSLTGFASGVENKKQLLKMESTVIKILGEEMRQREFQLNNIEGVTINRGEHSCSGNGSGRVRL